MDQYSCFECLNYGAQQWKRHKSEKESCASIQRVTKSDYNEIIFEQLITMEFNSFPNVREN